jgi:DNA-binding response OmpR family regulator
VPVIVLTALGDEDHLVDALQLGADDYLVKPFRPRELRARALALLRRSSAQGATQRRDYQSLSFGDITLDPGAHQATVDGTAVPLTPIEFSLLHYLMLNRNIVVRLSDIIANVWGYEADGNDEVVKVTVSRLRRKIEADPSQPRYIVNVPGVGYKFQEKEP